MVSGFILFTGMGLAVENGTVTTAPVESAVFNGPGVTGSTRITDQQLGKGSIDVNGNSLILKIIKFILPLVAFLAVAALVWAGTLYVISFGDDGKRETAKNIIIYVTLGILLILGSYAIVNLFMTGRFI